MDVCHADTAELSSGEARELQQIKWHRKQLLEDIQKLKDEIADVFAQIDCFESTEESRMAQKEKEMCIGRKKFNMDPAKVHIQGRGREPHQSGHLGGHRRKTWASPRYTDKLSKGGSCLLGTFAADPTNHPTGERAETPQGQAFGA